MRLTYWRMREVDQLMWDAPDARASAARLADALGGYVLLSTEPGPGPTFAEFKAAHRPVWRELDRSTLWVAPRWLAWVYRLLPYSIGWANQPEHQQARPPFFLWHVLAPTWRLAWLPASRRPEAGAHFGLLRVGDRTLCL